MKGRALHLLIILGLIIGCLQFGGEESGKSHARPPVESSSPARQPLPSEPPIPSSGVGDISFALEVDTEDFIGEDGKLVKKWFEETAARGVNVISFEPFNLDGEAIFDSSVLREAGFTLLPKVGNAFPEILREARGHNLEVIVMLEGVAHIVYSMKSYSDSIKPEKLTPEAVKQLIKEISETSARENAKVAVDEEAFPEVYMDAIWEATTRYNMKYVHFFEDLRCRPDIFVSEDYAYYPLDAKNDPGDADYMRRLYSWGSYYGKLGFLSIMFGAGTGCGKKTGVATAGGWGLGPRTHQNIALMRAVQFTPSFYMFVVGEGDGGPTFPEELSYVYSYNFGKNLLPLLQEFSRKSTDRPKKTANLIIDEPRKRDSDLMDFFTDALLSSSDAITNAILAAGYDLVVTASPLDNADLYYVFSPGIVFGEGEDLSPELASLVDGSTPVFFQVVGALPETPNWRKVSAALGIEGGYTVLVNADDKSFFDPIPIDAEYLFPAGEYMVKYGGYSFEVWDPKLLGKYSVGHYLHYINPAEISSEVLLQSLTAKDADGKFDDPTALVVKKNNLYFVNGGYLHLDASHVLANIMAELGGRGPVYNAPSYGYFTNGESRAVFFAPYDVEIDLNLFGGNRVTVFDDEGKKLQDPGLTLEKGRLKGRVKRFNLVIVD
jgi:hypothetical protein